MTISYMHEIDGEKEFGRIDVVSKSPQIKIESDEANDSAVYLKIDGNFIEIIGQEFGEPDIEKTVYMSRNQYRQIAKYLSDRPEPS